MKDRIGVFRLTYPAPSEAFISSQALNCRRYEPVVITRKMLGGEPIPTSKLSHQPGSFRYRSYLLTRDPGLWDLQFLRDLRLIHAHFGIDGVYAQRLAERLGIPLIVTFHGFDVFTSTFGLRPWSNPTAFQYVLGRGEMLARADAFVAVSQQVERALLKWGVPGRKIYKHYIGTDLGGRPNLDDKRRIAQSLVTVARLVKSKGVDDVIKAFSELLATHPNASLTIVGEGPEREHLESMCDALGCGRSVSFLGSIPHSRVKEILRQASIFTLGSKRLSNGYREAFGIVLIEASAAGTPIVATRSGGIAEAVEHETSGYLVEEGDYKAMAAHYRRLLDEPNTYESMSTAGRHRVEMHFDIIKQTKALEDIYETIIAR